VKTIMGIGYKMLSYSKLQIAHTSAWRMWKRLFQTPKRRSMQHRVLLWLSLYRSCTALAAFRYGVSRNGRHGYPLSPRRTPFSKPAKWYKYICKTMPKTHYRFFYNHTLYAKDNKIVLRIQWAKWWFHSHTSVMLI
jgi:hypothetical protein